MLGNNDPSPAVGVTLTGASHVQTWDGPAITFTLTEVQRVAALAISGVDGGNGGAIKLDLDAAAVYDMAGDTNPNAEQDATTTGLVVGETADTKVITVWYSQKAPKRDKPYHGVVVSQSEEEFRVLWDAEDGEEPEELLRAPLRLEGPLRPWRARQPAAGVAAER